MQDHARLKALREAARAGLEDVKAGRFRDFDTMQDLREHLDTVARSAIHAPRPHRRR